MKIISVKNRLQKIFFFNFSYIRYSLNCLALKQLVVLHLPANCSADSRVRDGFSLSKEDGFFLLEWHSTKYIFNKRSPFVFGAFQLITLSCWFILVLRLAITAALGGTGTNRCRAPLPKVGDLAWQTLILENIRPVNACSLASYFSEEFSSLSDEILVTKKLSFVNLCVSIVDLEAASGARCLYVVSLLPGLRCQITVCIGGTTGVIRIDFQRALKVFFFRRNVTFSSVNFRTFESLYLFDGHLYSSVILFFAWQFFASLSRSYFLVKISVLVSLGKLFPLQSY